MARQHVLSSEHEIDERRHAAELSYSCLAKVAFCSTCPAIRVYVGSLNEVVVLLQRSLDLATFMSSSRELQSARSLTQLIKQDLIVRPRRSRQKLRHGSISKQFVRNTNERTSFPPVSGLITQPSPVILFRVYAFTVCGQKFLAS